jgi:hypothetical protein
MALFITLSIGDMSLPGVGALGSSQSADILRSNQKHGQNVFAMIMGLLGSLTGKKQQHVQQNAPQHTPPSNFYNTQHMNSPVGMGQQSPYDYRYAKGL